MKSSHTTERLSCRTADSVAGQNWEYLSGQQKPAELSGVAPSSIIVSTSITALWFDSVVQFTALPMSSGQMHGLTDF